ncbi:Regulator of G-protein signaling loco [Fragariocoptes setiger]|uniref:Regulator of G-protein signaling loco n=1 Tax=Fragariocoptes setiger TaxID=1670756 RepID=A0ABQ7S5B5_9ACAR|nr:Regulator of G-protein signaling loco [Fragariocoptes setiger]
MLEPRRPSIELSTVSEVSEELSSCTCRLASSSANATQAQVPAVTVAEGAPRDTSSVRADIDSRAANRVANTHPVSPVSSTSLRGQDADDEDNEQAEVSELTTSEPLEVLVAPPPQFDTVRAHSCPHHHHVDNNALSNSNSNKSGQCLYGTQAGATLTLTTNLTTMTTTGDEAEWTERDVAPPSQFGATSVTVGGSAYDEQVEGQPLSSASTAGSFPSAPSDRQLASQSRLKHDDTIEDALPATSCDFDQVESICDEEVPPPLPPQDYATITDADKSRRTARKSSARSTSRELMIEETAMISDNDDDGGTREGYQQQQHDDDDDDYDDESSVSVSHGNVVVAPVTRASSATTRDNDNDNGVADNVASVSRVATMSSTESHTADIMRHLARHDACLDDGAEPNDDGHDHDHHNDDRFACDNYAAPAPIATASPTAAGCTEEPCTPELERDGWHSNATIRRRRRHDDAQHLNQSTSDAAEHVQHVQQVQQQQVVSASNDAQPEANYNNQTANEQRAAEMTQQQQQQQQRQHSNELETQMSTCSSCSCSSYDGATCTLQHKDCEFGDMMLQRQQQVHSQQSSSHQRQQQTNVEQIEGRVVKESDLDAADDDGMDALEAKESFNAVEFSASSSSIGGPNRHQAKAPVAASVTVVSGTDRSCEQQQAKAASETKGNNSSNADDNGDDDGTVHTANYWLRRWIYVSEHEEAEIWRRAIDMPMAGSQAATTVPTKSSQSQPQPHSAEQVEQAEPDQQQQQQQQSSESSATQATATGASVESQDKQSDDEQSTASEREFMSSYKSRTRKMIHRRATVEMYKRIMSNAFGVEKRVEISRSNGEFGFRIHGSRPVVVSAIEKGTCAETCGLQVGDLICAINGTNILDMPHSQVVRLAHSESSRLVLDLVPTNEFLRQRKYTQPNETRQPIISGFLMRLTLDGAATQDGARSADATAAKANDTNKRQKLSNDDDDDDIAQLHNKYQSTDSTIDNNSNACWRRRYVMLRSDNCLYWYRRETPLPRPASVAAIPVSIIRKWYCCFKCQHGRPHNLTTSRGTPNDRKSVIQPAANS